jgi:hypothetical protein
MDNLGKKIGTTDTNITIRIKEMKENLRHRRYDGRNLYPKISPHSYRHLRSKIMQ